MLAGLQLDLNSSLQPPDEFKVSTLLILLMYTVSVTECHVTLSVSAG